MSLGEPLQMYEVLMLLLLLIGAIPVTVQYLRYRCKWFYTAYLCFVGTAVLTNAEAFIAPVFLNYLEHVLLLIASFLFWATAYQSAESVVNADYRDVLADALPNRVFGE